MRKRSGKFYSANEKSLMKKFGLSPTKASGSGWLDKEDGENEHLLVQLKSTDAQSIRVNKLDIDKLVYHANVTHKVPVFMIEFINDEIFVMIRPEDLTLVSEYLKTGSINNNTSQINIVSESEFDNLNMDNKPKEIKSGNKKKYWEKRNREYQKKYKK